MEKVSFKREIILPKRLRCESPWSHGIGVNGSLATTFPSKMELNIDRREVKANPIANIDFIFTIIRSRLVDFNRSSSLSIFRFWVRSRVESPWASFFFSNFLVCLSMSFFKRWYFSVRYTISQVRPSPIKAVHMDMPRIKMASPHILVHTRRLKKEFQIHFFF